MTDAMTTKKPKKQKAPDLIPVELIDQLLAQVENKDAESILVARATIVTAAARRRSWHRVARCASRSRATA
jgi:hypothetical protein